MSFGSAKPKPAKVISKGTSPPITARYAPATTIPTTTYGKSVVPATTFGATVRPNTTLGTSSMAPRAATVLSGGISATTATAPVFMEAAITAPTTTIMAAPATTVMAAPATTVMASPATTLSAASPMMVAYAAAPRMAAPIAAPIVSEAIMAAPAVAAAPAVVTPATTTTMTAGSVKMPRVRSLQQLATTREHPVPLATTRHTWSPLQMKPTCTSTFVHRAVA